jgi:serine/threonine protein kinase
MTNRPPSTPPAIAGFTPLQLLGSGGYADVFLYEQHMPHRQVAVKVLVGDAMASEAQRRQFTAEANLMARVSTHPYIVTIFQADVASDGRPYIVMEYYPGDNFLRRARMERFGVAEALRVGIQVGSALETAHRAGILHRDIKPANILTSEFRRPGLADFGIAANQGPDADDTGGVSIPWSPPEAFGADELGVQADVYSLAATLYHLLAGRSPFELSVGDNTALGLIARIERDHLPSLGRPDVPASLERVLAQAMAKRPQQRPASVVEFLRQLQGVEAELKLAVTPLELADDGSSARLRSTGDDDDATRIRGVTEIQAQPTPLAIDHVPANPVGVGPVVQRPREGLLAPPQVADTVHRPAPSPSTLPPADEGAPPRTSKLPLVIGGVVVAVAAVVGIALSAGGDSGSQSVPSTQAAIVVIGSSRPAAVVAGSADLRADGSAVFTWSAPDAQEDDVYLVERTDTGQVSEERRTTVTLSDATSATCVKVKVSRVGVQDSDPTTWCVGG